MTLLQVPLDCEDLKKGSEPRQSDQSLLCNGPRFPNSGDGHWPTGPYNLTYRAQSRIALPGSLEVRCGCDLLRLLTCELTSGRSHTLLFLGHGKRQRSSGGSCVGLGLRELCGAEALAHL